MTRPVCRSTFAALVFCGLGCTGRIPAGDSPLGASGAAGASRSGGRGGAVDDPVNQPLPAFRPDVDPFSDDAGKLVDSAGRRPLRRLSGVEYANTIRDLFGQKLALDDLPPDAPDESGFLGGPNVSPLEAQAFLGYAESVSAAAAKNLAGLTGCAPKSASEEEPCARSFVTSVGKKVFRRPVTDAEAAELVTLYRSGRADARLDFAGAIALVLQGMLMSPRFLYHWELGSAVPKLTGGIVDLTDYEIASRLSYLLVQSTPDAALLAAADAGSLRDASTRETHARRLLGSAASHAALVSFVEQWLGLPNLALAGKDTKRYPSYDDGLRDAMARESRAFFEDVLFTNDGRWATLLAAPVGFVNQALAPVYGVSGVAGTTLQRQALDPRQRSGVLTQASVLTLYASAQEGSPIKRGRMVRERLLCQTPPPVPDGVPPLPPPQPNLPTREHFAQHSSNPACSVCHRLMDPIGFGFLHYDAIGAWQTMDGGSAVDSSGTVFDVDGKDSVAFDGAAELAKILTDSRQAQSCVVRQAFRYASGRLESTAEGASMSGAFTAFQGHDGDLRELVVAMVRSHAFVRRSPAQGEVLE